MFTCWERTEHCALLYVMCSCVFVHFPYGVLGHRGYVIFFCGYPLLIKRIQVSNPGSKGLLVDKYFQIWLSNLYRRSYKSAHVLFNLLNKLRKIEKPEACRAIYHFFATNLMNFNKTGAQKLGLIYHMTLI